jgi:secondary thiamine-phosphate synthase enzyme
MVYQKELSFSTSGHGDMHDLTEQLESILDDSHIRAGVVNIFAVGSTAGICSIEFEPGLKKDLPQILDNLIPPSRQYGHEQAWHDGNGHSHLQASVIGPDINVPIRDGKLVLGTWQQVVHVEFDIRHRNRSVVVTVSGEQ